MVYYFVAGWWLDGWIFIVRMLCFAWLVGIFSGRILVVAFGHVSQFTNEQPCVRFSLLNETTYVLVPTLAVVFTPLH